jgi:hypothetical protein
MFHEQDEHEWTEKRCNTPEAASGGSTTQYSDAKHTFYLYGNPLAKSSINKYSNENTVMGVLFWKLLLCASNLQIVNFKGRSYYVLGRSSSGMG